MKNSLLMNKIELLPETLQAEVMDFIDFLLLKYQLEQGVEINENLSETEKQELQQRLQKMREKPETNLSIVEFKAQILAKYKTQ